LTYDPADGDTRMGQSSGMTPERSALHTPLRRVFVCFQRSSTTKDTSFDTTFTTAHLVRAKGERL